MNRKKIVLKYKKERAVLSDVLPYEVPVTFSNRHFYEFLLLNKVDFSKGDIGWKSDDKALEIIIRLLFNGNLVTPPVADPTEVGKVRIKAQDGTIPFGFKISHKDKEYRELSICHPQNQLRVVDFYHWYKELILYYCGVSPFSIRKPEKLAKYTFFKDKTHYENLSEEGEHVEAFDKEYEILRSFFVYKDYSNINKFYESYKFHRSEKKYNKLHKLDITKCFDSIYTHSLAWALLNRESVKENLGSSNETFAGRFDELMRQLNYNETNGIIIGPEFSRIFAELILQAVDRAVVIELKDKNDLKHKKDYEVFRYVDDYFIFYNDEITKDKIYEVLQLELKKYKLYLNVNKAIVYNKPIITEISIAKEQVAKLLEKELSYKLTDIPDEEQKKGRINISSKDLITEFKTIIKQSEIEYKDILNYSLAIVERKCGKILSDFKNIKKEKNSEKDLIKAAIEILEFSFFIYSVSPRVNTTIKLCRILVIFSEFLKGKTVNKDFKHLVFKTIFDNICFTLKKNKSDEHTQVETLYLLVALSEMGRDYWLEESTLANYFGIKNVNNEFESDREFNYFSLVVLLFYMNSKKRYAKLRTFIEVKIKNKFEEKRRTLGKDTELTLLFFDCLTCPFISAGTKDYLLDFYDVGQQYKMAVIQKRPYWFTKWKDFDFRKALDAKRGQEVY